MVLSPLKSLSWPLSLMIVLVLWTAPRRVLGRSFDSSGGRVPWIVRGGSVDTPNKSRPEWLDMDREKLQGYMELAKERHADAVRKAQEAYWSASGTGEKVEVDTTALPEVQPYGIDAPPTWSLPDFCGAFDLSKTIYVTKTPLFTKEECNQLIQAAEAHFDGKWTALPSGQYDVAGFWIKSIPAVHEQFNEWVKTKLFPLLARQFPDFCNYDDLVVDNAYCFKYTPETGRRTDVHTDSGCLSFTIAVNAPDEYTGGGTWFQGLDSDTGLIEMEQGHVTVRPGGVRHCGHAVTEGTRYIIGGFCMHRSKVEYVRMLIGLGADRTTSGDYKGAQEALEAAIYLNPHFDSPYANLADVLQKQGNVEKAQRVLEHCYYNVNPQSGEVAYSLGVLYLDKEQYEKCKACMETCLGVDENDADAMMCMAQACQGMGDGDGERAWYQRLVETPGVPDKDAAAAYCNLGVLHEDTDEEIELYKKGLEIVPDHATLRFSLASAHAAKEEWADAALNFRLAVELLSDNPERQTRALKSLYRVAANMVQSEFQQQPPASQQAMMERLQSIMGKENFERLAASRGA